jgi:hypothetical protein
MWISEDADATSSPTEAVGLFDGPSSSERHNRCKNTEVSHLCISTCSREDKPAFVILPRPGYYQHIDPLSRGRPLLHSLRSLYVAEGDLRGKSGSEWPKDFGPRRRRRERLGGNPGDVSTWVGAGSTKYKTPQGSLASGVHSNTVVVKTCPRSCPRNAW